MSELDADGRPELVRAAHDAMAGDAALDAFAEAVRSVMGTSMAIVSLVDDTTQTPIGRAGYDGGPAPRDTVFCTTAIQQADMLVVPDASQDERFQKNPFVTPEGGIRFYAGAVVRAPEGQPLGTLCTFDPQGQEPAPDQLDRLRMLRDVFEMVLEKRLCG